MNELLDDQPPNSTGSAHGKIGCLLLAVVFAAVGGVAVKFHDVPYVDDALAGIDFDGIVTGIAERFQSANTEANLADAAMRAQAPEEEGRRRTGASGGRAAPDEQAQEMPPYDGPSSGFQAAGFDPDHVEIDFGTESSGGTGGSRFLTRQQIQRVMTQNQGDLLSCYGQELQQFPELMGTVDFDFAVAPSGEVKMVRVIESSLESKAAEDCFVQKARHWRFPATNQETHSRFDTDFTFAF